MEGFTKREIDQAKLARKVYHNLGCPTLESFKHAIKTNLVKNCPVTTEDAINAEKIFGEDIGALKGKTTRKAPPVVRDECVEIPDEIKERNNLTLCMDIMFIWGIPMLTSIDKTIRFRSLVVLENRSSKEIYRCITHILRFYTTSGYKISCINCDQEFRHLMDDI
jgi:hypothetical protein